MATEYLIACILFTIQIIEILRAKILKQILLRLFCRERVGMICKTPKTQYLCGVTSLLRCF